MNAVANRLYLRLARPGNADAIAGLMTLLGYPVEAGETAGRLERLLRHPDAAVLVGGLEDGPVQGCLALHFIPQLGLAGDFCRIAYFSVAPAAQGQGLGRALEAEATRLAQQRGCDRIEVHSHERRHGAHVFYRRRGYEESPRYLIRRP